MATTMRARIQTLDIVRGVAVMGILALNVYAFAGPGGMYFNPTAYGGDTGLDWFAWAFNFVFMESKFRALFSIMFGASTLLVIERATAKSDNPALRHYARMFWLLAFGLLHFWFIWWGDILALYALVGLVAFFFRNRSVKWLRNWAIIFLIVGFLFSGSQNFAYMMAGDPNLPEDERAGMAKMVDQNEGYFGGTSEAAQDKVQEHLEMFRGPYEPIMEQRFVDWRFKPFMNAIFIGPETLGLFLIGMALFKSGFLTGEWRRERYRKWAITCFAIAIPANLALLYYQVASGYSAQAVFNASIFLSMPFDLIMAIGWAALITMLVMNALESPLSKRLAATGRMAFTNYLGTSIVMTTLFYGYGFGRYGEYSRAELYLVVFAMWGLMLLWSKPWLERFHYGPLEWLWRSLSRFSLQPFAKKATA